MDREYLDYLAATLPGGLAGLRIVVDGANGSASSLASGVAGAAGRPRSNPFIARPTGATSICIAARSIWKPCARRCSKPARIWAWRFDGDADRALFVSHSGKIVDGDAVLLLTALPLHARGRLTGRGGHGDVEPGPGARAEASHGIGLVRTPVGDKYVLEEMLRRNAPLGGEQSGHIIFRDYATTGDGLLTALRVLEVMRATGQDLDELTRRDANLSAAPGERARAGAAPAG